MYIEHILLRYFYTSAHYKQSNLVAAEHLMQELSHFLHSLAFSSPKKPNSGHLIKHY